MRAVNTARRVYRLRPLSAVVLCLPALLIIILMPLTFTITIGIGAGMVMWVLLQVVAGRAAQVHWLMWLVFLAFLLFFAQTWVTTMLAG